MENDGIPIRRFFTTQQARARLGVCAKTLRNWDKAGKIKAVRGPNNIRYYDLSSVEGGLGVIAQRIPEERKDFVYARVSSTKQSAHLEHQIESLSAKYGGYEVVRDIGSGLNWKRPGLQRILRLSVEGKVRRVVVAHRDRLSRLAFDLIKFVVESAGGELVVDSDDDKDTSPTEELGEDLLSIMHVFSCREYGKRSYGGRKRKLDGAGDKKAKARKRDSNGEQPDHAVSNGSRVPTSGA